MSLLDDIGAGLFGAANSATFGALDPVTRFIGETVGGSDAVKAYDAWKKDKEEAMGIGDIVGTVGSMLIPGGGIVKGLGKVLGGLGRGAEALKLGKLAAGLGKGVKALDTVGDVIKGTRTIGATGGLLPKIGGAMLRGGLGAAETALPRALIAGPGSYGDAALSVGLGSALGPLSGLLSKKVGGLLGKKTQGSLLKSVGMDAGDFRQAATAGLPKSWRSVKAEKTRDLIEAVTDDLRAAKISTPKKLQARLKDPTFGAKDVAIERAANYNALNPLDRAQGLLKGEDAAGIIAQYGKVGEKALKNLTDEIRTMDWNQAKKYLSKVSTAARAEGSTAAAIARGEAARVIADSVDEIAERGIVPDRLARLSKEYPLRVVSELADERAAGKISPLFSAGSPTMEKSVISKLIGGGIGGATGASATGLDMADPSTYPQALIGLGVGSLLGGASSKLIPKAANWMAGKLGGANPAAGTLIPKALGALVGKPGAEGGAAVPGAAGEGAAEGSAEGEAVKAEAAIDATAEAAGAPEVAEAAKEKAKVQTNEKFAKALNERLMYLYNTKGFNVEGGPTFEEFAQYADELTDGGDPFKAAKLLFPDKTERAEYLRQYSVALAYASTDIEKALSFEGAGKTFGSTLSGWAAGMGLGDEAGYRDRAQSYESLKNIVEKLQGKPDSTAKAVQLKEIEENVAAIARLKATPAEKAEVFKQYLSDQGLSPDILEWGMLGGGAR
jgi:hypothetical protein